VVDAADLALVDEALGQLNRRTAPVVEVDVVLALGRLGGLVHLLGLPIVHRHRLFAVDVLPGLGRLDHDVVVQPGRSGNVDDVDVLAPDDLAPVRLHLLPTPPLGESFQLLRVAPAGHLEHGLDGEVEEVLGLPPGVAVGFAHELVADDRHVHPFHALILFRYCTLCSTALSSSS
jgi:hypothetical protein